MGILSDRLPDSVSVEGVRIPLATDFRRWILFTELMTDERADGRTRLRCAVEIVCRDPQSLPENRSGAFDTELFRQLAAFALMSDPPSGEECGNAGSSAQPEQPEQAFDFGIDGERICAAFLQCYGLDLLDEGLRLHWWKFLALLRHLPADCEFMRVVRLRCADLSRVSDDGVRKSLRRARAAVRIRKNRDPRSIRADGDPESVKQPDSLKGVMFHG